MLGHLVVLVSRAEARMYAILVPPCVGFGVVADQDRLPEWDPVCDR